jgi:hypothetical protein
MKFILSPEIGQKRCSCSPFLVFKIVIIVIIWSHGNVVGVRF